MRGCVSVCLDHADEDFAHRHGWGCKPDVTKAVTYLTAAASNAAAVEQLALQAGLKKGGAAKGELVLAIFELGNSFRHGWGTEKDAVAAKQVCSPPGQHPSPRPRIRANELGMELESWPGQRADRAQSTTKRPPTWAIPVRAATSSRA